MISSEGKFNITVTDVLAIFLSDSLVGQSARLESDVGNASRTATSVTHYLTVSLMDLQVHNNHSIV